MKNLRNQNLKILSSFPLGNAGQAETFPGDWERFNKIKWIGTYERIYRILYRTSEKLWCL